MSGFRLARAAERDLQGIKNHIAHDDLDAAERVLMRLVLACRLLAAHPGIGHRREDLTEGDFRFWSVDAYLVVYDPNTEPLAIVRVLHGRRDVQSALDGA